MVALDSTKNLLNTLSGRSLKLWLAPDRLPESLRGLAAARGEKSWTLAIQDYSDIERVLAELRVEGVQIREMELLQPDLEQVFLQMMHRK